MSDEYRRIYSKGYSAGSSGRWPDHKPPIPPDNIVHEIVIALMSLRDKVSSEISKFGEDDEIYLLLSEEIEKANLALKRMSNWIKE